MAKKPASTGDQQNDTRFQKGRSGNPAGRKPGSRNKLGGEYIDGLSLEFELNGQEAIARLRKDDPATFLKLIGNILPKQLETTLNITVYEEFEQARDFAAAWKVVKRAQAMIGAGELPPMIELEATEDATSD